MNSDYMAIKEFAKKAGVSTQYVYKQIRDGRLTEYIEIIDGKKFLNPEALEKIGKQKKGNQKQTDEQPLVSFLQDQLNAKDKQIAELQMALQRSQELLKREQDIRLVTEKRLMMLEEQQETEAEEPSGETEKAVTDSSGVGRTDSKQDNWRRSSDQSGGEAEKEQIHQNGSTEHVEKGRISIWKRFWGTIRG